MNLLNSYLKDSPFPNNGSSMIDEAILKSILGPISSTPGSVSAGGAGGLGVGVGGAGGGGVGGGTIPNSLSGIGPPGFVRNQYGSPNIG